MYRFLCLILLLLILPLASNAQEIRTNEKGEKIIVYPDGSWRYFNSDDDTLFGPDGSVFQQELIPTDPKERAAYLEEREREKAMLLANQASLNASRFEDIYKQKRTERLEVEQEIAELKAMGNQVDPVALEDLEKDLEEASRAESEAMADMQLASDLEKQAEKMIEMNRKKREKAMEDFEEGMATLFDAAEQETEKPAGEVVGATVDEGITPPVSEFVKYNPERDVMVYPPEPDCYLSFDGIDEFSGKERRDTRTRLFFTSTRDELRPYLNGKEYIVCEGQLTALSGGLLFLSLEFTIASKSAQQSFGGLMKGSLLSIKFLDGESVRLMNSKTDYGTYNPAEETYTFRAQYMINGSQERLLRNGEVDKVRVNWGTGYEDYEIYDLDFFRDLLRCLFDS